MATPSETIAKKRPTATKSPSRLLAALDREIKERALFSARTAEMRYLAEMQGVLADFTAGEIGEAEARRRLMSALAAFGYTPEGGFPDVDGDGGATLRTIRDLSSFGRINLVVDANAGMAASVSRLAEETDATLGLFPVWRLVRFMQPNGKARDWNVRWAAAGNAVGWRGAVADDFVARKDSPIWQALGDGAGGFKDTLGNPYPPFAFNSGMGWEDVDRDEAAELGLDLSSPVALKRPSLSVTDAELDKARKTFGDDFADSLSGDLGLANEQGRCPEDGAFLDADGECHSPNHGGGGKGGGLGGLTYQTDKYNHEERLLKEYKAGERMTADEVLSGGFVGIQTALRHGFEADFGGGKTLVFCLKNLDEKYGDPKSRKYDLERLTTLRAALAIRHKFTSLPHNGNQRIFIQQGNLREWERRIVIIASNHDGEYVARNVMRNDEGYIKKHFGWAQGKRKPGA